MDVCVYIWMCVCVYMYIILTNVFSPIFSLNRQWASVSIPLPE